MKSIHHHQPPPLSTLSKLNHTQQLNTHKLHYFSRHPPPPPLRTKAMAITSSHLVVLGVSPPPAATGDLSVLIPTSAGFLFLYWIANFVVPRIIMKDLESEDANKDQEPNEEGGMPLNKTISLEPEKKGFQGTK
ncbi:hypothetical protein L6452_39944 [Arctium lappa]|uniref:Uncharacterized protein n=1 Tax=Arctium lappa TaxID=4217 RepID=A0ACB8XTX9_ARCLA|nr:hypothetical protein L6452_39944 [Arctium lappa]